MCLDLTGPGKAQTWIQREISSSSTICEENDQTLVKVKRDRPSTAYCVWDGTALLCLLLSA